MPGRAPITGDGGDPGEDAPPGSSPPRRDPLGGCLAAVAVVVAVASAVGVPVVVAAVAGAELLPLAVGCGLLGLAPPYVALAVVAYKARGRAIGAGLTLAAAVLLGALGLCAGSDPVILAFMPVFLVFLWAGVGLALVASRVSRVR
jgi:hypothetical protein